MSFRFLANSAPGVHREEELTAARLAALAASPTGLTRSGTNSRQTTPQVDHAATPPSTSAATPGPPPPSSASVSPETTRSAADKHKDSPPSVAGGSALGIRRHVVFPDPVAFRYLEEDPSVTVLERRVLLTGYELYLVEQWACSRRSPTLVIVTYTGDPKHSVVVGVMGIPADEREWSPRLRVYFKAIQQYHARPKDTHLGELMVTNLSSFPSALTVIPVPDGDIRKHRQVFIVNEDLKRMGCSGRSGMTLSDPTAATQAKFLQLYKTSDRIPFFGAVLELVKLCQAALLIFGRLEHEYVDGLLCDVTEAAVNDWWTEIGSEYFNVEPSDGILGPTTVAALLGTLMGARNRLGWYGAPVPKDVFDVDATKRGIGYFQKAFKLERTRRLDRQTLLKLHSVTAKAAAGEGGWGVQKAVKSTVAEIGGKRGEMVIGMMSGGKDKANISDIETLDIDKLIDLAYGERAKWLWHGKAKRSTGLSSSGGGGGGDGYADRALPELGSAFFSGRDDTTGPGAAIGGVGAAAGLGGLGSQQTGSTTAVATSSSRRVQTLPLGSLGLGSSSGGGDEPLQLELRTKDESATMAFAQSAAVITPGPYSAPLLPSTSNTSNPANALSDGPASAAEKGDNSAALRKTVFKRVGGKVSDARSGFGRIRDVVGGGRRGHASRPSKDEGCGPPSGGGMADLGAAGYMMSPSIASLAQSATSLSSPVGVGRAFTWKNKPEEYANAFAAAARAREGVETGAGTGVDTTPPPKGGKTPPSRLAEEQQRRDSVSAAAAAIPPALPTPAAEGALINGGAATMTESVSVAGSAADESADLQAQMLAAFSRADDAVQATPAASWLQRRHSVSGGPTPHGGGGGATTTTTAAAAEKPLSSSSESAAAAAAIAIAIAAAAEDARWPRRLSFSVAEEAVLRWEEVLDVFEEVDPFEDDGDAESGGAGGGVLGDDDSSGALAARENGSSGGIVRIRLSSDKGSAEAARALFAHVASLRAALEPWVAARVGAVEALDDELGRQQDELQGLYYQLHDVYEAVRRQSAELVGEERSRLTESLRDVEVLSQRLEYEIGALASKVADVEDGVEEFERQVGAVEARADELKVQLETESWVHWAVRTLTGIGTGPNITRGENSRAAATAATAPR